MYYVVIDYENKKIDFFGDGVPTLFKKERHAKCCIGNMTFTDEEDKIIENPLESCVKILPCKSTFYSFIYFLKEDLSRFWFSIKYKKAYYFDKVFKTNLQKLVLKK